MTTTSELLETAFERHRAGRLDEAEQIYRQVLAAEPKNARAWHLLGVVAHGRRQHDQAVECLTRAVQLDPSQAIVHAHLSAANAARGHVEEAIDSMREVARLDPDQPKPLEDLGLLMAGLGRWEEAASCFRRALDVRPDYSSARINLGNTLNQQGRPLEAMECFGEVIRDNNQSVQAHNNLANTLKSLGRIDEAIEHYRRALAIEPNHAAAGQNLAHTLRSWKGDPLAGRTILIRCTHGLGDTIQFVRDVPAVRQAGAGQILLAAQPALHVLLTESGFDGLVQPDAENLVFDVESSIMDLRCVLCEPDAAIAAGPYLHASPTRIETWRQAMRGLNGFRVGIAWQGNRKFVWDPPRSIPLVQFEPLGQVPHVRLISLQKGDGVEQLSQIAGRFDVSDLPNTADRDFADTAAIMANLDLVITSDSAVAHLAGAVGLPVWVALPLDTDWRWQASGDHTEWYPNMRLFRQTQRGDWPGVFARLRDALSAVVSPNRQ